MLETDSIVAIPVKGVKYKYKLVITVTISLVKWFPKYKLKDGGVVLFQKYANGTKSNTAKN